MKKYIIFALVAILAAVLFVACDDDVMLDNNTAYTEILEADKAFVANGKGYDTLQEAIDAALGKGSKGLGSELVYAKVSLTKDIASRGASISGTDAKVEIDLNGHTLSFADVKDSALVVEEGTALRLSNGKVTLIGKAENLKVVAADGAAKVELNNTAVETADGQFALSAINETISVLVGNGSVVNGEVYIENGTFHLKDSVIAKTVTAVDATVYFEEGALVTGKVVAYDSVVKAKEGSEVVGDVTVYGEDGASFTIYPTAAVSSDIAVTGKATLESNSSDVYGTITVSGADSKYVVNADNKNVDLTILDNATVTVNENGIVTVVKVDDSGWKIVCDGNTEAQIIDASETPLDPSHFENSFCYVVIDGEKHYTGTLTEAIDLAVANETVVVYALNHTYTTTPVTETISKSVAIDLNGFTESNNLSVNDIVTLTVTGGNVAGTVSGEGTLVVDKADVQNTVAVGALTAKNGAEFNSSVTTTGAQTYNDTIFKPAADSVLTGSTVTIVNSLFNPITTTYKYGIVANGAANDVSTPVLTITKSVGEIGTIEATAGSIKIDGSNSTGLLHTGVITAWDGDSAYYDVTITGNSTYSVTVEGIAHADDVLSTYAVVTGDINAVILADGSSTAAGLSLFSGDVHTVGNQNYYGSVFTPTADLFAGAKINIYNATGSVGTINNTEVLIDNSALTGTETLSVGTISAKETVSAVDHYYDVTIKGNSTLKVEVGSITNAKDVTSSYVDFTGYIGEGGHIENITDENSTFRSSVFSSGLLSFNGSTFGVAANLLATSGHVVQTYYVNETSTTDVNVINMVGVNFLTGTGATSVRATGTTTGDFTSNTMSIRIQDATGVSGEIRAYDGNIVIDNDNGTSTTGNFETGTLNATNLVTLEGYTASEAAESGKLIIGSVYACSELHSQKTIFAGTVHASDIIEDGVVLDNTGSKFKSGVSSNGTARFVGSTFDASSNGSFIVSASSNVSMADVMFVPQTSETVVVGTVSVSSTMSTVSITKGLGTAGYISAGGQIVIDNSEYTGAGSLTTGTIYAEDGNPTYYDVKIKGSSISHVTVEGVANAAAVKTSYVQIGSINAESVQDGEWETGLAGYSTFNGDVTTTGSMIFNNSVFAGSPALTSNNAGDITLMDCTGSVGSIVSKGISTYVGTISINSTESTGTLYAGTVTSFYDADSDGYEYGETCGSIYITSPNSTGKLYFGNTGEARFEYHIIGDITLHDGASNNAGTLCLYGGAENEIDGSELNVYGGQYGDAGDSFMIESYGAHTTTAIHGGTFYTNEEQMLRFFSSHVHYNTSLDVEFKLGPQFVPAGTQTTLNGNLVIGKYTDGSRVNYNKKITFSSSDSGERTLTAYYDDDPATDYAVYVYAGTVTFNHVSFSNNYSDDFVTLHYCSAERGCYTLVDANVRKGRIVQDL